MSPRYVEPAVRELRGSTRDERVRLLVGISGDRADVVERLEGDPGVQAVESIGRATLKVTTRESGVDRLLDADGVKSVELDSDDVYSFGSDSGN